MQTFEYSVRTRHISKSFGNHHVLKDVSLDIAPGEFILLSGSSGSGKTTLLSIIAGIDSPCNGDIIVDGRISVVFQTGTLIDYLTVEENLFYYCSIHHSWDEGRATDLAQMLELQDLFARMPGELSGGQRQRVVILRSLLSEANIILADEPVSAQNSELKTIVMDLLKQDAIEKNRAVLVVSHDTRLRQWADRCLHMRKGVLHAHN